MTEEPRGRIIDLSIRQRAALAFLYETTGYKFPMVAPDPERYTAGAGDAPGEIVVRTLTELGEGWCFGVPVVTRSEAVQLARRMLTMTPRWSPTRACKLFPCAEGRLAWERWKETRAPLRFRDPDRISAQ